MHIRDCLTRVKDYTSKGKESFYEENLIQDAVMRNLEVMCESIKKLPDEWK
ncbi:HepT-like ribonuclease domain-containing protein, partial [Limnospira indica]|uniref:HepT-like ribonuclease domain-containing protein n=1 Tax=Limnospira indica TaxID=147322 RepID=UPI0030B85209